MCSNAWFFAALAAFAVAGLLISLVVLEQKNKKIKKLEKATNAPRRNTSVEHQVFKAEDRQKHFACRIKNAVFGTSMGVLCDKSIKLFFKDNDRWIIVRALLDPDGMGLIRGTRDLGHTVVEIEVLRDQVLLKVGPEVDCDFSLTDDAIEALIHLIKAHIVGWHVNRYEH